VVVFVRYLFTEKRFGWDSWDNGVFLAGYGAMQVVSQGLLLPRLIPRRLSEHSVVSLGFWTNCVVFALYGLVRSSSSWVLFAVLPASMLGTLPEPVLRHVLTQLAGPQDQGALQGFVAALSTLG
jgi:DHA1 family tetracycline resistance protein-like MFS transporter